MSLQGVGSSLDGHSWLNFNANVYFRLFQFVQLNCNVFPNILTNRNKYKFLSSNNKKYFSSLKKLLGNQNHRFPLSNWSLIRSVLVKFPKF